MINLMVQVTVWFGKGSTGDEREMAKALAITKNPEPELMFEGQEQGSFWSDLGGKQEYFTDLVSRQEEDDAEPRFFQLSSASGNITMEEVVDFSQEDLIGIVKQPTHDHNMKSFLFSQRRML